MTSLLTLQLEEFKFFSVLDHLLYICMSNIEEVSKSGYKFFPLILVSLLLTYSMFAQPLPKKPSSFLYSGESGELVGLFSPRLVTLR